MTQPAWPTVAPTTSGEVRGGADRHDTIAWRGVPFARPPVADLRWRAPRDAIPWTGVRDCLEFAAAPWQPGVDGSSEDCLYLNVWRPAGARDRLPVYVWLPGGANRVQMPALSVTPGALLASRSEVVVVTVSYRVNEMGWFTHPALRDGADALDNSGNYGTLDIINALTWVRDNIAGFGGDPHNVFVTGESAGAYNTLTLLVSPAAAGLLHKAMAQSGRQDTHSMQEADQRADTILQRLLEAEGGRAGDVATFLRNRSPDQVAAAARGLRWFAGYRDGTVIDAKGFDALDDGRYANKIPVIVGMNKEESKFQLQRNTELQEDRALYEAVAKVGSDHKRATGCDAVLRRLRGNAGQPPVYGYLFSWGWDGGDRPSPLPEPQSWILGAAHGQDIQFFLHGARRGDEANRAGREALSAAMMGYVRNFAHTGAPSAPDPSLPAWEPWDNEPDGPKLIEFDGDRERAIVTMGRDELTIDDVHALMDTMPDDVVDTARRVVRTMA